MKKAPDPFLSETPEGLSLLVRVIPRAGSTKIAGTRDGRLLIRLAAAPVDGAANQALVDFLSTLLKIPERHVTVAAGHRSRDKRMLIEGLAAADARTRLA